MKILILADINTPHTLKWVTELIKENITVEVFSLAKIKPSLQKSVEGIPIYSRSFGEKYFVKDETYFQKLLYLTSLFSLCRLIKKSKPDILHAHYASSYGLLGALTNFHPFIVSVWGSDVFDFPRKSSIHKYVMKYVFKKADKILSTSNIMAKETALYTRKHITITPFGVDTSKFLPHTSFKLFYNNPIVIGTVKSLQEKYGIKYLLKSFAIVRSKHPELILKLLIVGEGTDENHLKKLTQKLGINEDTIFTGRITPNEVSAYHAQLSIAVFPSIFESESFGVAVLEASSCKVPVVASRIGGLPEVVDDGITGFLVSPRDENALTEAIEKLVLNKSLRERMGEAGRKFVQKHYALKDSVSIMISQYREILHSRKID